MFHVCPVELQMALDVLRPFVFFVPAVVLWAGAALKKW